MIVLELTNNKVRIHNTTIPIIRKIKKATSYFVNGYMYSKKFQSGSWDGKIGTLKYSKKNGYYTPAGLLHVLIDCFEEHEIEYRVEDKRLYPDYRIKYNWNDKITLRDYQQDGIDAVTQPGLHYGRCILKHCIRSGKTKTGAGIIKKMGLRTLFIVTSQTLLYQAIDDLSDTLNEEVGCIGDGNWDERNITVATIQTLLNNSGFTKKRKIKKEDGLCGFVKEKQEPTEKYLKLIKRYDLIIIDEFHHYKNTDSWGFVLSDFQTPFKVGLSATVFFDEKEKSKGAIHMKSNCGEIVHSVEMDDLIKLGYLMRPDVLIYPIKYPDRLDKKWSSKLANECIFENQYRNRIIAEIAVEYIKQGLRVVIVSRRIKQVEDIYYKLDEYNVSVGVITGQIKEKERRAQLIDSFRNGDIDVLVGTILNEGVDIKEINVVINASGGLDRKDTIQKMRSLTIQEGKTTAKVIDFADKTNSYFAKQSLARIQEYRKHKLFNIEIIG